jgi:hypothetical protein
MTNKFDINNTFDPDDENKAPKVSKEVATKLPTPAKGVDHYLRRTDTDPRAAKVIKVINGVHIQVSTKTKVGKAKV